ncbi:MAG: D-sedoheptulose-7-phosphate isomerase [Planctomycetota bacterium]|jgi:D-sedoheptulose 7-phosphate isomerase
MNENTKKQITETIEIHKKMLCEFEEKCIDTIASVAELITKTIKQGGRVYICGNGGSAADAQHIAGELVGRFRRERKGLPVIALSTDSSVITSIANDYSYDNVFERQVEALIKENDILWAISTSGRSANVVAAAKLAKEKGAKVIVFTGKTPSQLQEIAEVSFCADSKLSFRIQEIHQLAYHIICDLVEQNFCE